MYPVQDCEVFTFKVLCRLSCKVVCRIANDGDKYVCRWGCLNSSLHGILHELGFKYWFTLCFFVERIQRCAEPSLFNTYVYLFN